MFLAADAQPVLDISKPIHQKTFLFFWQCSLNDHQVYALEDGFQGDSHLFQT
jgi:hypothetical protein